MRTIYNIAKTELKNLFFSPIAWLILLVFAIQTFLPFIDFIEGYAKRGAINLSSSDITSKIFAGRFGLFTDVIKYLYLYIPLLTMGLMSREISSGSIKLLFSSPISFKQIIFGKFLATMIYGVVLLIPLIILTILGGFTITNCDITLLISGLIGIYLLICAYSAIGLFMSSLTSYQVVAAMGTLVVLGLLNFVGKVGQDISFIRDITYWLSITGRAKDMVNGLLTTEAVLYFSIIVGMFISFTVIKFKAGKIKNRVKTASNYFLVIFIGCLLGYISSRPLFIGYLDMTTKNCRTLTKISQDLIKKIDGKLTITTYVNILDKNKRYGMPKFISRDKNRFSTYYRFKSDIDMKYVYYWDKSPEKELYERHPGKTDKQLAERICKIYGYDFNDLLTPKQIREKIDLSSEDNKFVRTVESENGKKAWLRTFDDLNVHPFESEISAVLKKLTIDAPKIGFLVGHGERDGYKLGDRDFGIPMQTKNFRYSLINQGFDFCKVNFDDGYVPDDVTILVIADTKTSFSKKGNKVLDEFIKRGGNLLIAAEVKRERKMQQILNRFGVKINKGVIVKENDKFIPTLTVSDLYKDGAKKTSYIFNSLFHTGESISMPSALSLDYSNTKAKGFDCIPLLKTSMKCWNELETTDFVDKPIYLNSSIGEMQGTKVTGVALTRKINNIDQRIIIMGDSDCFSNKEIIATRSGINSNNFAFLTATFGWLSNGVMPIDTRRESLKDTSIKIHLDTVWYFRIILIYLLPLILILFYLSIWNKRRRK